MPPFTDGVPCWRAVPVSVAVATQGCAAAFSGVGPGGPASIDTMCARPLIARDDVTQSSTVCSSSLPFLGIQDEAPVNRKGQVNGQADEQAVARRGNAPGRERP